MSSQTILPHAGHISEFGNDPTNGHWWNTTCTQTALEVCLAAIDGRTPTFTHMTAITRDMIAKHLCNPDGSSTLHGVAVEAQQLGYSIADEWDYAEPLQRDWHGLFMRYAGINPILIQVAWGQNLIDAETGARDEAGLRYHAIALVGKQGDGYVCADGDNPQVGSRFQIYSYATLAAAVPCGLLMLNMPQQAPVPAPNPSPIGVTHMPLPTGWSDNGTTLTAPNGVAVIHGFRDYLLANPTILDVMANPVAVEYGTSYGARQDFYGGMLQWFQDRPAATSVAIGPAGQLAAELEPANAALNAQIDLLKQSADQDVQQIAALNTKITELEAKLAAVPSPVIAPPTPAPVSPTYDPLEHALALAVLNLVNAKIIQHNQATTGVTA